MVFKKLVKTFGRKEKVRTNGNQGPKDVKVTDTKKPVDAVKKEADAKTEPPTSPRPVVDKMDPPNTPPESPIAAQPSPIPEESREDAVSASQSERQQAPKPQQQEGGEPEENKDSEKPTTVTSTGSAGSANTSGAAKEGGDESQNSHPHPLSSLSSKEEKGGDKEGEEEASAQPKEAEPAGEAPKAVVEDVHYETVEDAEREDAAQRKAFTCCGIAVPVE